MSDRLAREARTSAVAPARPHERLTEDGRRMREVLTYSRRGSRFQPKQQEAWDAHHEAWWIPDDVVGEPGFSFAERFDRDAPLIIEIGCGIGEATAALAARRPDANVVGFEVWRPGIASGLGAVAAAGATNVRFVSVDAVWSLEHLVAADSLAGLWTFFPDPWPKERHAKRRLIQPAFATLAASRLAVGAEWRLATDWAPYAEQMRAVLDAEPMLDGGEVPRWADRPVTKFERKGLAKGRTIVDFRYVRR